MGSKYYLPTYDTTHKFHSSTVLTMSQSKFWCFTLNNYTDDDEQGIGEFLASRFVSYGVVGREVGESGTPHLQGFVILNRAQRLSYLRNRLSARAHYEIARGTPQQASDYCKKDGDFEEWGTLPVSNQGRRSDLDAVVEWIDQFTTENGRPPESPDFAKHQPRAYIKYPRLTRTAELRCPPRRLEFGELNEWQQHLHDELTLNDADDRKVKYIIDEEGRKGKSWFCRWMFSEYPDDVQILGVGKKEDIAHMLDTNKQIFLVNCARGQMQYVSTALLENMKDRIVPSPKYGSRMKMWYKKVHVVVFGNEAPDETKMTEDRYDIQYI